MSLENAADEIKLAVDLIMLLEQHAIPTETVLKALKIVEQDFLRKKEQAESAAEGLAKQKESDAL